MQARPSAMDRFRPRAREIVTVARKLLEDEGLQSFSMRKLADRLGVRAPVIYKYFASKSALVAALISVGFEEQGALFEAALTTSDSALTAMAAIYRAYGRDTPISTASCTTGTSTGHCCSPVARNAR